APRARGTPRHRRRRFGAGAASLSTVRAHSTGSGISSCQRAHQVEERRNRSSVRLIATGGTSGGGYSSCPDAGAVAIRTSLTGAATPCSQGRDPVCGMRTLRRCTIGASTRSVTAAAAGSGCPRPTGSWSAARGRSRGLGLAGRARPRATPRRRQEAGADVGNRGGLMTLIRRGCRGIALPFCLGA
ncbi:MAG: hypothetical protein K0R44_2167, partial [Thermomicrobiales bacterium]|nr:hypothetical protein [Thermomicrobiales bacterium]